MKIVIKEYETDKILKKIDCNGMSEKEIDKFDDGLNINLNHELYYTEIVK